MATQMTLNYFIKCGEGALDQVKVETTTTIGDIRDKIYADQKYFFDRYLLAKADLGLYRSLDLNRKPVKELRQRVDRLDLGDARDIYHTVGGIFESRLDPELVHIVIVPRPVVPSKRQGEDDLDESRGLKRARFCNDSPSSLPAAYPSIQKLSEQRIMDDIPKPDADVPPISLLFDGFGQFLDTCRAYDPHPIVTDNLTRSLYHSLVDEFAKEMCRIWDSEYARNTVCLSYLNRIFSAVCLTDVNLVATYIEDGIISDGHFLTKHGTAAVILKVNNNSMQGHIHAQLAGYYGHSCRQASEGNKELFRKWRAPCLGIGLCDSWITFYAILLLDNKPRVVNLTPWLSFILSASDRDQRNALYAAIYAASVLIKRILEDAERPDRNQHASTMFPYISSLPKEGATSDVLNFTIVGSFGPRRESRFMYVAKTENDQEILIKFSRHYSVELHRFCASRGQAPKLLGFKKLPGGWFAIAMEYVSTASHLSENNHNAELRDKLISELRALVSSFHDEGLVHGDLRQPNILYNGKTVMLVDFDWGGREGEVSYPIGQLCDELLNGRSINDWKIRKADDLRVMENTVFDILRSSST